MKSSQAIANGLYDKALRQKLLDNPAMVSELLDYNNEDAVFSVKENTKDITYVVIPIEQTDIGLTDMANINAAANTASSAGSASSVSTAGSASSTLSTVSSAGSGSSIGTVKT